MKLPVFRTETADAPSREIARGLADVGAIVCEGHGVSPQLLENAISASRRTFALPSPVKARYRGPIDGSQRGYLPLRTTLPNGRETLDRKEAWHARPAGHPASNLFPAEVPELGPSLLALLGELERVAERVSRSIDAFLGRDPEHMVGTLEGADSLFRVNHYPDAQGAERARFLAHQDFDYFTLLLGATSPGLEIQTRSGVWQPIEMGPEGILVTVGDLLEVDSEGKLPATPHRVVAPAHADGGRISMVYFVSPRPDVVLAGGVPASEIVDARLREAGYA